MKKTQRRTRAVLTPEEEQLWYVNYCFFQKDSVPLPKSFADFKTDVLARLRVKRRHPYRHYRYDKAWYKQRKPFPLLKGMAFWAVRDDDVENGRMDATLYTMNVQYRRGSGFYRPEIKELFPATEGVIKLNPYGIKPPRRRKTKIIRPSPYDEWQKNGYRI